MWIKRHLRKKHEPVVVIPDNYGSHFTAWWNNIQPQWRLQPDGSYSTACLLMRTGQPYEKGVLVAYTLLLCLFHGGLLLLHRVVVIQLFGFWLMTLSGYCNRSTTSTGYLPKVNVYRMKHNQNNQKGN